uniref:Uncharacterized protein n=1 Tax=Caenorhabditis tropicalis TaxID=1561998 RepID=A0A1I7T368_9PELO
MDPEEDKKKEVKVEIIEKTEVTVVVVVKKPVQAQASFFIPTAPIRIQKPKESQPLTGIEELKVRFLGLIRMRMQCFLRRETISQSLTTSQCGDPKASRRFGRIMLQSF